MYWKARRNRCHTISNNCIVYNIGHGNKQKEFRRYKVLSLTFSEIVICLLSAGVICYLLPYITVLGLFIIGLIITIISDTVNRIKKLFGK